MSTLLIKNARYVISCDDNDTLYERVNLFIRDGVIRSIGPDFHQADSVIDASSMAVYPGLINTHHHLYQLFSRNLPEVQKMELFPWLVTLYEVWKRLDEEVVTWSSLTGLGELLKTGCTTCFDHHYVFPRGAGDLIAAQFRAAGQVGIRFMASRGSMDLSQKDGGLPPDSVVQTIDEILTDSERLVRVWHDPWGCGSTPTWLRPGTRSSSPWRNSACAPSGTWNPWAGWDPMCGMPTASTSTTMSCAFWPRPAPAWPTVPSPI